MAAFSQPLALIRPPTPDPKPSCFLAGFTTFVHERKAGKVLVDFPLAIYPDRLTERRWVPRKWVAWEI